jgi:hypothetical protein
MALECGVDTPSLDSKHLEELGPKSLGLTPLTGLVVPRVSKANRGFTDVVATRADHTQMSTI